MKTIVLVVDTPERDLKGIALLAHWLTGKHGCKTVVTTTKNELAALIAHKPALIVVPHVRYERHKEFLDFARAQGTAVVVLPAEGYAGTDRLIGKTLVGFEHLQPYVDMVLAWGTRTRDFCRQLPGLAEAEVHSAGCPRFDFLRPAYDSLAPARETFCRGLGLDPARPLVTWFSSSKYANPPGGLKAWLEAFMAPRDGAGKIIAKDVDVAAKGRDHQRAFDGIMDIFLRLVRAQPDLNFVVKPHPAEPREPFVRALSGRSNVRVLDNSTQSTDLVRWTDVQINWRCMTSAEAWLRDLGSKVISIEVPGLEMSDFEGLTVGNEIVRSYEELEAVVGRYLSGGVVSPELVEKRREFLRQYLHDHENTAGERCADLLVDFLRRRPQVRRTLSAFKVIARRLPGRIKRGRWIVYARRPGEHKYFAHDEFHRWMDDLTALSGRAVTRKGYEIEA